MNAHNHASNVIPISRAVRARPRPQQNIAKHAAKPRQSGHLRENPRLLDYAILTICVLAALAIGRYLPRIIASNTPPPISHSMW